MPTTRPQRTREILKLQFDVPIQARLEQIHGAECPSRVNGVEYRYAVVSNNGPATLYLPAEARDVLVALQPQVGDVIEVFKTKQRGQIIWSINPVNDAAEPPAQQASQAAGPRLLAPRPANNGYVNGHAAASNGYKVPLSAPQATATAPPARGNSHLAQCLCSAIDAALHASEYARGKNFSVTFLGSDIRAMANSLMINSENGGGR